MSKVIPTTSNIAATYRLLQLLPPFDRLTLPAADEVIFEELPGVALVWGIYDTVNGRHRIRIAQHYTLTGFIATIAHEMLHLHQAVTGKDTADEHNQAFRRLVRKAVSSLALECGGF